MLLHPKNGPHTYPPIAGLKPDLTLWLFRARFLLLDRGVIFRMDYNRLNFAPSKLSSGRGLGIGGKTEKQNQELHVITSSVNPKKGLRVKVQEITCNDSRRKYSM